MRIRRSDARAERRGWAGARSRQVSRAATGPTSLLRANCRAPHSRLTQLRGPTGAGPRVCPVSSKPTRHASLRTGGCAPPSRVGMWVERVWLLMPGAHMSPAGRFGEPLGGFRERPFRRRAATGTFGRQGDWKDTGQAERPFSPARNPGDRSAAPSAGHPRAASAAGELPDARARPSPRDSPLQPRGAGREAENAAEGAADARALRR